MLELGLSKLQSGELAFEFVSQENFNSLLQSIEEAGISLLFPKQQRTVIYAALSEVIEIRSPRADCIRFAVLIPTDRLMDPFHLYKLETVGVHNASSNLVVQFQPEHQYYAISKTLQSVSLLKTLESCRQILQETWCPANVAIFLSAQQPTCENELFFSRRPSENCVKLISLLKTPSFQIRQTGIQYSLPVGSKVAIHCAEHHSRPSKQPLYGTGFIKLPPGCSLTADGTTVTVLEFLPSKKNLSTNIDPITFIMNTSDSINKINENHETIQHILQKSEVPTITVTDLLQQLNFINTEELDIATQWKSAVEDSQGMNILFTLFITAVGIMTIKVLMYICRVSGLCNSLKLCQKNNQNLDELLIELNNLKVRVRRMEVVLPTGNPTGSLNEELIPLNCTSRI